MTNEQIQYFPPAAFEMNEDHNSFIVSWYSSYLKAMQEPSLWSYSEDQEHHSYRFLWLPTFDQPEASRLLIAKSGEGQIVKKKTDGKGGYQAGSLIVNDTKALSKASVDKFLATVDELGFWNLPTKDNSLGCDGEQWILEGVKDRKYHVVDRWLPKKGAFREIAIALINLSNLGENSVH